MDDVIVHGKVIPWGGSMGIRISKAEAERAGLKEGQELNLRVLSPKDRLDVSHFHTVHGGGAGKDHDRILGRARSRS